MQLIAITDQNWNIGYKNKLLFHIPEDMRFFKSCTIGHTVVMGRKTYESIGKALPDRTNIVITRDQDFHADDAIVLHSLQDIPIQDPNLWCIGGAQLYQQLLPYCDTAYITKVNTTVPADASIPDRNRLPDWHLTHLSEEKHWKDLSYRFSVYKKTYSNPCTKT